MTEVDRPERDTKRTEKVKRFVIEMFRIKDINLITFKKTFEHA